MSHFVAIDLELANNNLSSICQIGIAVFKDDQLIETWSTYVNPEEFFSPFNTRIHGITARQVYGSPKKHEIIEPLLHYLEGKSIVSYGTLDKQVIFLNYPDLLKNIHWIDVTTIVRKVWPQFSKGGFALNKMADYLGIEQTNHHDALEDAIICGEILCEALYESNTRLEHWQK
ncbi:exonuclease domain-containing protein [Pelistega ratti]|uniref:exonuclease domain-containing protein n=1 Tax=Pelistega ratti TaxID=2652177 RepID=UPI001358A328|nr:exonuclease domain-containing protein [Pelistega ratti]